MTGMAGMSSMVRAGVVLAALAMQLVTSSAAMAQQRRAAPQSAEFKPALVKDAGSAQDWTVHVRLRVATEQPGRTFSRDLATPRPRLGLTKMHLLFPLIPDTGTSIARPDKFKTKLYSDAISTTEHRVEGGYQGLSSVAIVDAADVLTTAFFLDVDIAMTSYETRLNEEIARGAEWPAASWSNELALCLEPQQYVAVDDPSVAALVQRVTQGKPRGMPPFVLAKRLAAECIAHVNLTEELFNNRGVSQAWRGIGVPPTDQFAPVKGTVRGYNVSGAAWAGREKRGNVFDLACLYTAALRHAGIPARMVLGYDIDASEKAEKPVLRAWTEFFLPRRVTTPPATPGQPAPEPVVTASDGEWIPVDIGRQKQFASRAPSLSQSWPFFGNNNESDRLCPVAFHWIPPVEGARSQSPAMWAWVVEPADPPVTAYVTIWADFTPRRGDDPPRR
jgi:hypothetical protein